MADLKNGKKVGSLNYSYEEAEAMPAGELKALVYISYGLNVDGGHHKQWFLEEICKALGYSLADLARAMDQGEHKAKARAINPQSEEFSTWERGIAP